MKWCLICDLEVGCLGNQQYRQRNHVKDMASLSWVWLWKSLHKLTCLSSWSPVGWCCFRKLWSLLGWILVGSLRHWRWIVGNYRVWPHLKPAFYSWLYMQYDSCLILMHHACLTMGDSLSPNCKPKINTSPLKVLLARLGLRNET